MKWKSENGNGKEPSFSNGAEAKHFSIFPIPYSIALVSDLLAVSQVADGVVRRRTFVDCC